VHRIRNSVNEAAWIGVEREAERRRTTGRNSRSSNEAIGGEARRIVDAISDAVH
jgi:hypothetical protein